MELSDTNDARIEPFLNTQRTTAEDFTATLAVHSTMNDSGGPSTKPLKLVIFRPNMAEGGADRVTVTLLRHLDRNRFEPTLVLMRREGVLLPEIPEDVPVVDLQGWRLRSAWLSLARFLREASPDILFSMSSGGNPVASLAHLLSRSKSRLVLSRRNILNSRETDSAAGRAFAPLHRMLYRRADAVLAISKGVAEDLVSILDVPPRLVSVVYNPLPEKLIGGTRSAAPPHPWFQERIPVLLATGRLVEQKDYPTLLHAFAIVHRRTAVRLIVLGKGPLLEALEDQCAELGIADDVCFAGWVSDPTEYMRWCTVFVLSSQWEGLCTALLEALGCGAAAVSTDCRAGPSELITHGENGLLVPVGDPGALAESILNLLENDELRNRFGENARLRARQFSAPGIVARYESSLLGAAGLRSEGADA